MKKFLFSKLLAAFLILFGLNCGVSAQTSVFTKGDMVVNAGIGIGTYINDKGFSMTIPPISASFEYGIVSLFDGDGAIGVGGYAGYLLRSRNVAGEDKYNVGNFVIGPRGLFHYQFVDKLDTYAGLMIGYDVVSFSQKDVPLSGSGFSSAFFVGARYYLIDNFAVWGELGYGISPLQLGIAYKF